MVEGVEGFVPSGSGSDAWDRDRDTDPSIILVDRVGGEGGEVNHGGSYTR